MLNIKKLENSGFFKTLILEKGELLFDEGDVNQNIYIVRLGELTVERYINKNREDTKILGFIKSNEILGEAALNNNNPKQVKILATKKTYLLYINANEGLNNFSKKFPEENKELLKYMIHLGNKRLLESNNLITISYKVSKEIMKLKTIDNKSLFSFIDKLKEIVNVNHILYFEKNQVMKNFLTLKYDTRESGKMQDKIVESTENKLNILDLKINNFFDFVQKISIGDNILGYLIFIKKGTKFTENDKKILIGISIGISGLIKQKIMFEEENNKKYMENY